MGEKIRIMVTPRDTEWTICGKARRALKERGLFSEEFDVRSMSAPSLMKFLEKEFHLEREE